MARSLLPSLNRSKRIAGTFRDRSVFDGHVEVLEGVAGGEASTDDVVGASEVEDTVADFGVFVVEVHESSFTR